MKTQEENIILYNVSKRVYDNTISKKDGVNELVKANFKYNSAMIIIPLFKKMLDGENLTRTLAVDLFEYFLSQILIDYGPSKLSLALTSLKLHIEYVGAKGDSKIKLKAVCETYANKLKYLNTSFQPNAENEKEQDEIIEYLEKTKTKEEIIKDLRQKTPIEPQLIFVNNKQYKRDNKTIAEIKIARDFQCQICNTFILKKDGKRYVEAAHIISKSDRGQELPENIILLCPNHHKEFDLGDCQIKTQTKSHIELLINGKNYTINLVI